MTVKERILAIRLSESIHRQPDYADHIGVSIVEHKDRNINCANRNKGKINIPERINTDKLYYHH